MGAVADVVGADATPSPLQGFSFGGRAGQVGGVLSSAYGTIQMNADGSYVYTLDSTNNSVRALNKGETLVEVVNYVLSDADGDTTATTLTITINGVSNGKPSIQAKDMNGTSVGQATVQEAGLTATADTSEFVTGTIQVGAPDGLDSVNLGGVLLNLSQLTALSATTPQSIPTTAGALVLIGYDTGTGLLSYRYELTKAQSQSGADSTDAVTLQVKDKAGQTADGTLTVQIVDDVPTAVNNAASITEDAVPNTVAGNVVTGAPGADRIGADANPAPLTGFSLGSVQGTVGSVLTTMYGSVVLNSDGSYVYTLDNSKTAVQALNKGDVLQEVVTYVISDGDGDTATAQLTITINGQSDGKPSIEPRDNNGAATGQATVNESGLNDPNDYSEKTSGVIVVVPPDGLQSITVGGLTLLPGDLATLSTAPRTVTTAVGTLLLTGYSTITGELQYSYTLTKVESQSGSESTDTFALSVTDKGGVTSGGTLTVRIVDDTPTAVDDAGSITENSASISGNVVTDLPGKDRIGVDATPIPLAEYSIGGTKATLAGTPLSTRYGTIQINADGSYVYTLDNNLPAVNALGAGDTLVDIIDYVITDADGDTSTAKLRITINGVTEPDPSIQAKDNNGAVSGQSTVEERGLE